MRNRRQWGWLLVPVGLIAVAWAVPPRDDFAAFAREGRPISEDDFMRLRSDPPRITLEGIGLSKDRRHRAWLLPEPFHRVSNRLAARNFRQQGYSEIRVHGDGECASHLREQQFGLDGTAVGVWLIEGTTLPKGSGCAVLIEEPVGIGAAWGRFVARRQGFPKP